MSQYLGLQLLAAGRAGVPKAFDFNGSQYRLEKVFKHDFFAATALYSPVGSSASRLVLKLSRQGDFIGIPLSWLGRLLSDHEYRILTHLQGLDGIARLAGRYGSTGILYEYVEGRSLDEKPEVPDDFFVQLGQLLDRIHSKDIAYIDMNKRGNILLRSDGSPSMIDFQISLHMPKNPLVGSRRLIQYVFRRLVAEDAYHLLKHKRRLRPDQMNDLEISESRRISSLIGLHRFLARPVTRVRRCLLAFLWHKKVLMTDQNQDRSPENDPSRWAG